MTVNASRNPYLVGDFAPVHEERDDSKLSVAGAISSELDGLLLRNGPNPIVEPEPSDHHWFIGDGMLPDIELAEGRARYHNRWVRTPKAATETGEPAPSGAADAGAIQSVSNTNVAAHAGRIYAFAETVLPTEVRANLSTVGAFDFDGKGTGNLTADPKFDPVAGEMLFFGYELFGQPYVNYRVVPTVERTALGTCPSGGLRGARIAAIRYSQTERRASSAKSA